MSVAELKLREESISLSADPLSGQLVTVIERRPGWKALDLRELWRYRELLYFITYRDVMAKYKQTVFGVAWTVVQPLTQMVVFSVIFGRFVGLERNTGDVPYPVFVFIGMVAWSQFAKALSGSGNSVVANSALVTKVYFPRILIPIASIGATLVDFAISFVLLIGLMFWYGVVPGPQIALLPVLVVLLHLAALGIGIFSSAVTVKYRDMRYAIGFVVQIWMYLTPVIYPVTIIPERFRGLLAFNPMTGIIDGFRYSLAGSSLDWTSFWVATTITLIGFVAAVFYFRRVESEFADII